MTEVRQASAVDQSLVSAVIASGFAFHAAKRNGRNQVWPRFVSTLRSEPVALAEHRSQAK